MKAGFRRPLGAAMALAALLGAGLAALTPSIGSAQVDGSGELTIEVDVEAGVIEVRELLQPSVSGPIEVRIPPTATDVDVDVRILSDSTNEGVSRDLTLDIGAGNATLSYRVPDDGDEPGGQEVRVSAEAVAFSLWPNMQTTTVRVVLSGGLMANMGDDFLEEDIGQGRYQYVLVSASIDRLWGLRFVAFHEEGLTRRTIELEGGAVVELAGWADDPEWLDYAERYVSDGVPLLAELIDQPWPATELELIESTAPGEEGYGGWYDLRKAQIEVSEDRDPELLLHELAHLWFNDSFLDHRWLIEGFAEAYSQEAVERLGDDVAGITSPGAAPDRFEGLNRWRSRFFFEDNFDEEIYGYRASSFVVSELLDEIGPEAMATVLDQLVDDRHPYAVDGDRRAIGTNDWRRFLDAVEIHGGSTGAERLFRRYVVTPGQQELLDERREAVDAFQAFEDEVASGNRAMVPEGIRHAMSDWDFDDAMRGIGRATDARQRLADLSERADAIDLTVPAFLEDAYLTSDAGFRRIDVALDDAEAVLAGLELGGDDVTEEDRRNFALGRFDQMDLAASVDDGARLNQAGGAGSSPWRWYAVIAGGLVLALVVLAAVAARMPPPSPPPRGDDGDDGDGDLTPTPPSPSDVPVYPS